MKPKLIMLAGDGESTRYVYHALSRSFDVSEVIIEDSVPMKTFLQRRIRKLGVVKVAGQVGFQAAVLPLLRRSGEDRLEEIRQSYGLDNREIPEEKITRVESVNAEAAREALRRANPDLVIVNGTRIIGAETLESVAVPFVNIHAGITPTYRGVHGAYWALRERDDARCGVTVHLVDTGIDTGSVLAQAFVRVAPNDNFATYPLLQLAHGLPLLIDQIERFSRERELKGYAADGPSKLRTHPTVWGYCVDRVRLGVK